MYVPNLECVIQETRRKQLTRQAKSRILSNRGEKKARNQTLPGVRLSTTSTSLPGSTSATHSLTPWNPQTVARAQGHAPHARTTHAQRTRACAVLIVGAPPLYVPT